MDERQLDERIRTVTRQWGLNVRDRRQRQFLSQAALAESVQRDQSWVSRYERGVAGFGVEAMVLLAHALDEDPAVLFPWPRRDGEEGAAGR